jgi:pSer/pThr/pTyr-binding forkhead associated (FHA) protein
LFSSPHSSPSAGEGSGIRRPSTAVLIVLSGARAGTRRALTADFATLGRHPSSELQLDPEQDTEVSARHAAVFRQGPGYVVRDLGSATGTWVNGVRVRSDRSLENGDRIQLGAQGPEIEFAVEQAQERAPARLVGADEQLAVTPVAARRTPVIEQEQSMTELKLRVEAARQTDRLRRRLFIAGVAAALGVVAVVMWLAWSARQSQLALEREQARLLGSVDSVHALLGGAAERAPGLRTALASARTEVERLRVRIITDATSHEAIATLEPQVRQELEGHAPLLRAARFDPSAIVAANRRAIALVFVQLAGDERRRVSGFVLRVSADTGWVVTARAPLVDSTGAPAERVSVGFNGGTQAWRARVIAEQTATGLALLRVQAWGHVFPVVEVRDSTPATEGPVVIFGFPENTEQNWQRDGLRASALTGTLAGASEDRLEIEGYGVGLRSGSPVFDVEGRLIGVMVAGEPGAKLLPAAPASALRPWRRE